MNIWYFVLVWSNSYSSHKDINRYWKLQWFVQVKLRHKKLQFSVFERSHADIGNVLISPEDNNEIEPDDENDVIDNCKNITDGNNKINSAGKILLRGHSQPHLLAQKQEKGFI